MFSSCLQTPIQSHKSSNIALDLQIHLSPQSSDPTSNCPHERLPTVFQIPFTTLVDVWRRSLQPSSLNYI
ncbi:hypothetical protein M378DRAFT_162779 [Amanita muscaria Koide BX008]|uniref:Uncharacterized protein n=1 Tax=Amanita muscaria (strain Koide BX008) TaxID=946122 RepID=A0A0C2X6J9_AMAMK|nr:hypothetical protein M378DRAFT_162779 [Amanita muscaria Koide BX008]